MIEQAGARAIVIVNKIDALSAGEAGKQIEIEMGEAGEEGELDERGKGREKVLKPALCLSAKEESGVRGLTDFLGRIINDRYNLYGPTSSELCFTRARYLSALQACQADLSQFLASPYADLCSHHLAEAVRRVEEVVGRVESEEVLDRIFSTFCVGK